MSNNYAIVQDGNIIDVVLWDGEAQWTPPEGTDAVPCGNNVCQVGGTYIDNVFSPPAVEPPTKEEYIQQAESMKAMLLGDINTKTQPWQIQLMLGIISDEDKTSLTTWMKYYQAVQAVDTSKAPNINWPQM